MNDITETTSETITRRLIAGDTPETIAAELSLDLEDDCTILLPGWYEARKEAEVVADSFRAGDESAA